MTRKLVLQLHRWLGLISGLVVFIVGITGALYAFEKELRYIFHRDLYNVPVLNQKVNMDSLLLVAGRAKVLVPLEKINDIHTGSILGLAGKLLACLVSLIAAALPVTGFIIWWGKKKKAAGKSNKIQRVSVLATAT